MLKIRRPLGRLIFNMGIAIPGKTVFLIETAPWSRCNDCNFTDFFFLGVNIPACSDNGLAPKRRKTIIWTNDQLVYWQTYAPPCLDELTTYALYFSWLHSSALASFWAIKPGVVQFGYTCKFFGVLWEQSKLCVRKWLSYEVDLFLQGDNLLRMIKPSGEYTCFILGCQAECASACDIVLL